MRGILEYLKEEKAQRKQERKKAKAELRRKMEGQRRKSKKRVVERRRSEPISKEFLSVSDDSDFDLESSLIGIKGTDNLPFHTPVARKSASITYSSQMQTRRTPKSTERSRSSNHFSPVVVKTEGLCSSSSQPVSSIVKREGRTNRLLTFSSSSNSDDSSIEVNILDNDFETDEESDNVFENLNKMSASSSVSKKNRPPHGPSRGKKTRKSSAFVKNRQMGHSDYGIETGTAEDIGGSLDDRSDSEEIGHLKRKRITTTSSSSEVSAQEKQLRKKPLVSLLSSDSGEEGEAGAVNTLTVSPIPSSSAIKHSSTGAMADSASMYLLASPETSTSDEEVVKRKPTSRRKLWPDNYNSDNDSDDFLGPPQTSARRTIHLRKRKIGKRVRKGFLSSESEEELDSNESSNNSSGSDNSDETPIQTTPGKRKDIKKLIPEAKLAAETKQAQKAERDRLKRLEERRKQLGVGGEGARLILEKDSETKEVKLEVRNLLLDPLLPHQRDGIKFLYNCCCEDLERLKKEEGSGAILAHCMGLGKTLQVSESVCCVVKDT